MEWSWWVTSNNACEASEQLIVLANGDDESDLAGWSLLLLAATVWSFAQFLLGLSNSKKVMLWPGCARCRARCSIHKKNMRSVRVVVKEGMLLQPLRWRFRWMCDSPRPGCARRIIPIYMWREQAVRVIMACHLYCYLPPQCKDLCTCHSGFPIATLAKHFRTQLTRCCIWPALLEYNHLSGAQKWKLRTHILVRLWKGIGFWMLWKPRNASKNCWL